MTRAVASSVIAVTYDLPPLASAEDIAVTRISAFTDRLDHASHIGAFFVDMFPLLNRLPSRIAWWKAEAKKWHDADTEMFTEFYDDAQRRLVIVSLPRFIQS